MPTISMFRGIKISMYWNDHMPPHFHATYGGEELNSMRNVGYYLAKGLDRKTAEYFAEGRKRIVHVVPNDNFTLVISFDNGEKRLYDVAPLLQTGTVFAPFRELKNFRRVYVDESHCIAWDIDPNVDSNVVWSNKVDLCPDSCYIDSVPLSGGVPNV